MKNLLIIALLAVVAALVLSRYKPEWVPFLAPERVTRGAREEIDLTLPKARDSQAPDQSAPTMYRWTDGQGKVNVSDKPPSGRPYETLRYDPETNVLPAPMPEPKPQ